MWGANENLFTFCENERKRSIRYERLRIITIGFFAVTENLRGVTSSIVRFYHPNSSQHRDF